MTWNILIVVLVLALVATLIAVVAQTNIDKQAEAREPVDEETAEGDAVPDQAVFEPVEQELSEQPEVAAGSILVGTLAVDEALGPEPAQENTPLLETTPIIDENVETFDPGITGDTVVAAKLVDGAQDQTSQPVTAEPGPERPADAPVAREFSQQPDLAADPTLVDAVTVNSAMDSEGAIEESPLLESPPGTEAIVATSDLTDPAASGEALDAVQAESELPVTTELSPVQVEPGSGGHDVGGEDVTTETSIATVDGTRVAELLPEDTPEPVIAPGNDEFADQGDPGTFADPATTDADEKAPDVSHLPDTAELFAPDFVPLAEYLAQEMSGNAPDAVGAPAESVPVERLPDTAELFAPVAEPVAEPLESSEDTDSSEQSEPGVPEATH